MSDKPLTLAAVTGAHGVSGEVRLKLFGEGVDALKAASVLFGGDSAANSEIKSSAPARALRCLAYRSLATEPPSTLDGNSWSVQILPEGWGTAAEMVATPISLS